MGLAPLVIFVYNRPEYLERTLASVYKNRQVGETPLIVFADGPKANATESELARIHTAREVARDAAKYFGSFQLIERPENLGLAKSIISGLHEVALQHDKFIVLEDDLELSPYFLEFMNGALEVYREDDRVMSIGGCNFFASGERVPETFFIPIPDCLGWATWSDRWKLFEPDGGKLLKALRERDLMDSFNLDGAYDFESLLESQVAGKSSSWAIRWQAVSYLTGKLNLYSRFAVSNHIGIDSNATNSAGVDYTQTVTFPSEPVRVEKKAPEVDPEVMRLMTNYYSVSFSGKPKRKRSPIRAFLKKLLP